ncbi:CARDB domain-containing protein [Thermosulfurimonas sp. F29]|uniref:CARDB domain-containing protein n=1 Tax=Thermosulfurimonas sp. F29 TaxID=2867247 RepID=UPI001C83081D|nr:CARDB domain-containing protein [Thermosulfurimonas sp. F29]MBX6423528.1 hypothetical protein [Thermosulfurimonas sp. F29]
MLWNVEVVCPKTVDTREFFCPGCQSWVKDRYLIKEKTLVINSLNRNSKTYVSITFPVISDKSHIIKVDPDFTHQYSSSSEVKEFFLMTCKRPDLIVMVDRIKNKNLLDKVTFRVRVKNAGYSPTTENARVKLTIQRKENHYFTVPPLDVGQEWTDTFTKRFYTTGIKRYSAYVDIDGVIPESDETNNFTAGRFQVFTHTEPMPEDNPRPPQLILKEIYGIPETQTIDASARFEPFLVLQCYSPDHVPCPKVLEIFGIFNGKTKLVEMYGSSIVYPGETIRFKLNGYRLEPGILSESPWLDFSLKILRGSNGNYTLIPLLERRYRVAKSQGVTSGIASVMKKKYSSLLGTGKKNPHPLTIISPTKDKVWTKGRTYQVAWIGEARGPYTLSLIFPDHPGEPIKFAENVSGRSFDLLVRRELPHGLYRIKVEGRDGWGVSEAFRIRSSTPPRLRIKAGSISQEISKCKTKPYKVKINLMIENKGGYQDQPFPVRFTFSRGRKLVKQKEILAGPLLDNRELSLKRTFNLKTGGRYDISIHVGRKSSKGPSETTFEKRGYLIKPLPDLRVAYQQEGNRLKFIVKNIGDGIANPSYLRLKYKPKRSQSVSAPGWNKEGDFLVHDPIPVKAIGAGRWIEIEGPSFPVPVSGGEVFYVTVNPAREISELCDLNNTVSGTLTSSPSSQPPAPEDLFEIKDRTPHTFKVRISPQTQVHVPFDFTLRNGSSRQATPPVEVVLTVTQGQRENSYPYRVPPLLTSAMGARDEFHLTKTLSFPSTEGDISYKLWIPGEGGGTVLSEGVVKVKQWR